MRDQGPIVLGTMYVHSIDIHSKVFLIKVSIKKEQLDARTQSTSEGIMDSIACGGHNSP